MQHDSATGEEKIFIDASRLVQDNAETPLEIVDYSWSDGERFMFRLTTDFLHEKLPLAKNIESQP